MNSAFNISNVNMTLKPDVLTRLPTYDNFFFCTRNNVVLTGHVFIFITYDNLIEKFEITL